MVACHLTANGISGKISQQTGKNSQQSGNISQQTEKNSQQSGNISQQIGKKLMARICCEMTEYQGSFILIFLSKTVHLSLL